MALLILFNIIIFFFLEILDFFYCFSHLEKGCVSCVLNIHVYMYSGTNAEVLYLLY